MPNLCIYICMRTTLNIDEAMHLIDAHKLAGKGLGWIDMHLLASARLSRLPLWTKDRRLATAARVLGVAEPKQPPARGQAN